MGDHKIIISGVPGNPWGMGNNQGITGEFLEKSPVVSHWSSMGNPIPRRSPVLTGKFVVTGELPVVLTGKYATDPPLNRNKAGHTDTH